MGKKSRSSSTSSSSSSSGSDHGKKKAPRKEAKEADVLQVKAERSSISPVRGVKKEKAKSARSRSASPSTSAIKEKEQQTRKNKKDDVLTNRTGGAYIPPARLRAMQESITDKSSTAYQRISWEAIKKSIHGIVNKVNVSNISIICRELFGENILRGRGLLSRSILQAQGASPTFTNVYAALVAIINTKFPAIGELILSRLVLVFRRSFRRNQKDLCLNACRFVAHLVNQQVVHEIMALEILTLLLENPTDDSVEVAVGFIKEIGLKLSEVSPRALNAIFERMRNILHEASIDKRTQYMIEVLFAIRKDGFSEHPIVLEELDLVEEDDQFTHMIHIDGEHKGEEMLNVFKTDPDFLENEKNYLSIRKEILGESDDDSSSSSSGSDSSDSDDSDDGQAAMVDAAKGTADGMGETVIIDHTEINTVQLRRTIYLTIQSSVDFEECVHKLLKLQIPEKMWKEMCHMIVDCCGQNRTYEKFFGLTATRLCMLKREYMELFELIFVEQYETIHRLETNKLRNVGKFFSQLLYADAIPWSVLSAIVITEETTTSSSRIFIKILFQELSQYMGLPKLNERLQEDTMQVFFEGIFPKDNPKNTRFAINFFTSIGLGGLTDELRDFLKKGALKGAGSDMESSSSSSSSSSDSSDSSDSDEAENIEDLFNKLQKKKETDVKAERDSSEERKPRRKSREERNRKSRDRRESRDSRPRRQRSRSAQKEASKKSAAKSKSRRDRERDESSEDERRSKERKEPSRRKKRSASRERRARRSRDRSGSRDRKRHRSPKVERDDSSERESRRKKDRRTQNRRASRSADRSRSRNRA